MLKHLFNMITNKNEAKTMKKNISCDCKCKFNSTACNSNQKLNDESCQCKCRNYRKCKKDYSWNPSTFNCEESKYLKSIADTVIRHDEIVPVIDTVSTKITNTIATNVSINSDNKKVRYYYILSIFIY